MKQIYLYILFLLFNSTNLLAFDYAQLNSSTEDNSHSKDTSPSKDISAFMVVDCLLPGQVRQLGSMRYIAARKAIKTSTSDCELR